MRTLEKLLSLRKRIRVIGFDDAPFLRGRDRRVSLVGAVCSDTRFEGMLWGEVTLDGRDATDRLLESLMASKFYHQVNLVLLDGITLGGFNVVDLPRLATDLDRPCIAVMRKYPDMEAVDRALHHYPDYEWRKRTIAAAGKIHSHHHLFYQVSGCRPDTAARALVRLTDMGKIPEALRLAHLIGSAVMTGQSSRRA